jgi:hypothetical protein
MQRRATQTVPINITTRTNKARYTQGGTAELVNCHVEQIGQEGKVTEYVVASDGLQGFAALPGVTGGVREILEADAKVWAVCGTSARLFEILSNGNVTDRGALSGFDETGPVYMARNRRSTPDIAIVNNGLLFNWRTSLAQVTDADLLAPQSLTVNDGQFAVATVDNKYQVGEIDDGTAWDGLSVERGDASPDANVRIYARQGQLLLFGQVTTEILNNAGLADGTGYERVQVVEFGCLAPKSVATVAGTVYWVAHDRTVRALDGYTPVEISDAFISREIQRVEDPTTINAFSWVRDGNSFYTINSSEWTYSYNTKTNRWNTRKSHLSKSYNIGTAVSAFGRVLVGSSTEPIIYEMSPNFFSDAGQPLVSQMTFSPLVVPGKKIDISRVWWDIERGVGTGQGADQDIDPEVLLDWSLDGGATFTGSRKIKLGQQGRRTNELETWRLGQCKGLGFVFRLTCSARVAKAIYQGQAEIAVSG